MYVCLHSFISLILLMFQRQLSQISKFYLQPRGRWMQGFLFNHVLSKALGEAENVVKIVMKPSASHRVTLADRLPAV